jgi:hypothetical protein
MGLETAFWRSFGSYYDEPRCLAILQLAIDASRQPATNRSLALERTRLAGAMQQFGPGPELLTEESEFRMNGHVFSIHGWIEEVVTDSVASSLRPFRAETEREMVVAAIAIKRYQIRHGKLPANLSLMVPEFLAHLPRDYMDGQLLRYRTNSQNGFVLYSVGFDGKDDGGDDTSFPKKSGHETWPAGRDWIWPQPITSQGRD